MKEITKKNTNSVHFLNLKDLISEPLSLLNKSDCNYEKKSLELCHAGKFLLLLNSGLRIEQLREQPDFILKNPNNECIGLEHEILVDDDSKKTEGSFKDLVKSAEIMFHENHPNEIIHVNVFAKPEYRFSKSDKPLLVDRLQKMIENKVYHDKFVENELVRKITWSKHSILHFSCNLGAWVQKSLISEHLIDSINKKEEKVKKYILSTGLINQWLLIVIGSLGESSYEFDSRFDYNFKINSSFEKIFLMEDFNSRLFELK